MSAADHVLAVDVGTQSVRAMVVSPRGELVAFGRVPIQPYVAPRPGWAEQDPEVWWTAMGEACRAVLGQPGARRDAVAGVALTTQRATIVVADDQGRPLRPAIVWLDQRRTEGLPRLGGYWGIAFAAGRVTETVARFQADAELNWIRAFEPEVWARIRRYGVLSAWLTSRMVGRWVDSTAAQVGYLPFDFRRSRWAGRLDWKWQVAPFDREWLAELVPPTGILGELTRETAEHLGLPPGLPMIAAAGDKQCEALGAGALDPGLAAISLGTTASIATTHPRYIEAIPLVPPYPAALPGRWQVELQVIRGLWLVEWYRREFGAEVEARAAATGERPEAILDAEAGAIGPGAQGLTVLPHWSPGIRYPGPEAKGAIVGFGDVHGRAHVYRAILEGLAYALREHAERLVSRGGTGIAELRVAGGGARSDVAVRILADVLGRPAARPHTSEASGLGAAIVGAVGLGIHRDASTAVGEMVRINDRIEPDPAAVGLYDDLYRDVYRPLAGRLAPVNRAIRRITGYPPS